MKKSLLKTLTTILLLGGGLLTLTTLTSCENFLNGAEVKQEITDAIAYNNAKELTVLIKSEEGTGSTVPSGNYTAKQGYNFEVSFSEAPDYSFVKWIAVAKNNPAQIITQGVTFSDENNPKTKVKISNDTTAIQIVPLCTERIKSNQVYPQYSSTGVGRTRSINVEFSKELSPESFIFTSDEIPEGAEVKTSSDNKIWAYTIDGQTYLKNISITSLDGLSLAEYFIQPQVSGTYLTVETSKEKLIPFDIDETSKTVLVTLSSHITDKKGVSMAADKSWRYLIVEASDEKATINFTALPAEGSINAVSKQYSVGQKVALSFTENPDYQFIKWNYDSAYITINEPEKADTAFLVINQTTEAQPTQIKAVCAPRLRVKAFSPETGSSLPSVSKNTPLSITFSQNLPAAGDGLSQLENITISIGGSSVKSSFLSPVVSGSTVSFAADPSNMLEVPAGQIKTVTVSIPADFYYQLEDGTKVYYGGKGASFDYKIDESTTEKAYVIFDKTANSGTLTPTENQYGYSLNQEVALKFVPASNYQFNGWTVKDSLGSDVPESKIKIEDSSALTTKLYVYEALSGVTVKANASEKLTVSGSPSSGTNVKDAKIEINFNKPLPGACGSQDFLKQIKVKLDGTSVDSYFATRSLNGSKITLTNTKYLNVTGNEIKTVSVMVPQTFYYSDGGINVYLEKDYNFEYDVSSETTGKTTIEYSLAEAGSGSINQAASVNYNAGETTDLKFTLTEGWQFNGWKITATDGSPIASDKIKIEDPSAQITKLTVLAPLEKTVSVQAEAILLPSVTAHSPADDVFAMSNQPVVITFNMPMQENQFDYASDNVSIKYGSTDLSSYFYEPSFNSDKTVLTLQPKDADLYNYIKSKNLANISLRISLAKEISVTKVIDGITYTLPLIQNAQSSFTVKYKNEIENTKPVKFGFFATVSEITLDSAGSPTTVTDEEKFIYEEIASQGTFTDEEYKSKLIQNRIGSYFYIYGRYYDEDSGVKSVRVTHKRTNSKDGTVVTEALVTPPLFTKDSPNAQFITKDGYTDFCIKYEIADDVSKSDLGDGAIRINVSVIDAVGNETEAESFTVIRDNYINLTDAEIWNVMSEEATSFNTTINIWYKNIDTIKELYINKMPKHINFSTPLSLYNGVTFYNSEKGNIYLGYESKSGSVKQEMQWNEEKKLWETDLNVDKVGGLDLTLYVQNEFGKEAEKNYKLPDTLKYHIGQVSSNYGYIIDYDTNLLISIQFSGDSRGDEYLYKDKSGLAPYFFNKYVAVSDKGGRIVSDFVQITEALPTEQSTQPVDCISDFSVASNECHIQLKDDVWDKYSSIYIQFYGVEKMTSSWKTLPVDATDYQRLYDYSEFSYTLSKEDGYNLNELFSMNFLENCLRIKMEISAIESDTGLLASSEVIYNINPVGENQGSVTADTYPPQMELSVLSPDERFSLFGNAEECIDDYLKVTATDFYIDGNNVFFSDFNHFELYINNKKIADFKPEELSHPENKIFGIPLYGRYYDENNNCSCKVIAYDNNNNYVEKIIDTVNSYKDVAKIRNWSYSNGICEVNMADNYEGNDYRLRVYKLQGKKWEYVTTYSSGTPSYRNHRFCVDVLPDSIYKFVPELKISSCLYFRDTFIVNTSDKNNGNYDIFLKNGTQANSYVISSDSCVFVQTVTTLEAYDTCKNWDAATWEANFPRHVGDAALNFSPSDHSPQSYTVPIDKIHEGECYCVIATFADGTKAMSEVMQR